jgi:hypothetical protein
MVLAISFVEAPLKFRAPGVTLQVGLGIGRLVFRALNCAEVLMAAAIAVALGLSNPPAAVVVSLAVAAGLLIVQLVGVRPRLTRRSDAVLAGQDIPRSHAHYVYVVLEVAKIVALTLGGILLLSS